jgi:CheY-like chemotaxis protein
MRNVTVFSLYSSILAMTENAFTEDMEKSKEAGMDEHLSKPVDIAVLERAVRKYLVTPENERPSTEIYPVSP